LGGVRRRVPQEEVRVEAAAADDDRYAVDGEAPCPAWHSGGAADQAGGDVADAELLGGGVADRAALRDRGAQRVQRLGAELGGPPDRGVGGVQRRVVGGRDRHGLGGVRRYRDGLAPRDRAAAAGRGGGGRAARAGLGGGRAVDDVRLHGQR